MFLQLTVYSKTANSSKILLDAGSVVDPTGQGSTHILGM